INHIDNYVAKNYTITDDDITNNYIEYSSRICFQDFKSNVTNVTYYVNYYFTCCNPPYVYYTYYYYDYYHNILTLSIIFMAVGICGVVHYLSVKSILFNSNESKPKSVLSVLSVHFLLFIILITNIFICFGPWPRLNKKNDKNYDK